MSRFLIIAKQPVLYYELDHRRREEPADSPDGWENKMIERVGMVKVEMDIRGDANDAGNGGHLNHLDIPITSL